jgi:hypothetical protein
LQYVLEEDDPRNRIIKFANASDPVAWPKAPSEYLCIFEAINQVGAALFAADWTANELDAVEWRESPKQLNKRISENYGGGAPGGSSGPARKIGRPMITQGFLPPELVKQQNAHVFAWHLERREMAWERNKAAATRLRETVNWLAQRCRDSEIGSYARLRSGGGLWPMTAWEWNIDDPFTTFVCNGGHKRFFPEFKSSGPYEAFLFFSRTGMAAVLDRFGRTPLQVFEADLSRLSPYIQLAVRLALRKGYFGKDSCDTQAVREAEVRAAWPDAMREIPMTENTVQLVARTMGFPDTVAIQRGSKGGRAKSR